MSCLSWNYRGLGNPRKVQALKKIISSKGPSFVFLCETKLLRRELEGVSRKLGYTYCFGVDCNLEREGRRGGLGLWWNEEGLLEVHSYSSNHIDVTVGVDSQWRFTGVYRFPEDNNKWKTWRMIEYLANLSSLPWMLLGDFNEILYDFEKRGGNLKREYRMTEFCDCLEKCGLHDMGFVGQVYTWSNKQSGGDNIQERLDRGVASVDWSERFPSARVSHLTRVLSDHCPLFVEWERSEVLEKRRWKKCRFRFEEMWLGERVCEDIISEAWEGLGGLFLWPIYCEAYTDYERGN